MDNFILFYTVKYISSGSQKSEKYFYKFRKDLMRICYFRVDNFL